MIKDTLKAAVTQSGIDEISEKIAEWGKQNKAGKKDLIRIRLSVEEALLSLLAKNEEFGEVTVKFESRL